LVIATEQEIRYTSIINVPYIDGSVAVAEDKTPKKVRRVYSLTIGSTFAVMGNQTVTHVTDPASGRVFSVTLIWERQGGQQSIAAPYRIQINAGRLDPVNTAQVDRRLGNKLSEIDYPITSTLMRRIPYERIIDASRIALNENSDFHITVGVPLIHPMTSHELVKPKKPGRPFDRTDDFYQEIAKRYLEAKAQGGSIARKPTLYIENFVKREIKHLEPQHRSTQIRKWIREARKRGYLDPVVKPKTR
jgi:hypothetical protein